jgi:preprotein translocase subunit YajC
MLEGLKNGDKVVTSGGVMGTVVGVKEKVVTLRVADNVRIEVMRSYIAGHQAGPDMASKE